MIINALIRLGVGLFGLAMLLEVFLPTVRENATVDRHSMATRPDHTGDRWSTETSYTLHFFGSKLGSCDVGLNAYNATQDGDAVAVRHTRILRHCTSIDRAGARLYTSHGWRWLYALCGTGALLAALGVFHRFTFEGREVY